MSAEGQYTGTIREWCAAASRRAATLSFTAECMEVDAVAGKPFDIDLFGQLTDRLGRCLQRLGLERKTRDVTPSLSAYLAGKAAP